MFNNLVSSAPKSWEEIFQFAAPELRDIEKILNSETRHILPLRENLFRAFELTRLEEVTVVIIGQDPYHDLYEGTPRADGLAFSNNRIIPKTKLSSSLKTIFSELGFNSPHGDLTRWAQQGVLLLNSALTVCQGAPGSHKRIWLGFINKVINGICASTKKPIFLLFGKEAQRIEQMLNSSAIRLTCGHPSGLARGARDPFLGSGIFDKCNKALIEIGKNPINWTDLETISEDSS